MKKYLCKNCNYRFESQSDQRGRKCPYCNREDVKEEMSAEELLEEDEL